MIHGDYEVDMNKTVEELDCTSQRRSICTGHLHLMRTDFAVNNGDKVFIRIFRGVYGSWCIYGSLDLLIIVSLYNDLYPEDGVGYIVTLCSLQWFVKCKVCISKMQDKNVFVYDLCICLYFGLFMHFRYWGIVFRIFYIYICVICQVHPLKEIRICFKNQFHKPMTM